MYVLLYIIVKRRERFTPNLDHNNTEVDNKRINDDQCKLKVKKLNIRKRLPRLNFEGDNRLRFNSKEIINKNIVPLPRSPIERKLARSQLSKKHNLLLAGSKTPLNANLFRPQRNLSTTIDLKKKLGRDESSPSKSSLKGFNQYIESLVRNIMSPAVYKRRNISLKHNITSFTYTLI